MKTFLILLLVAGCGGMWYCYAHNARVKTEIAEMEAHIQGLQVELERSAAYTEAQQSVADAYRALEARINALSAEIKEQAARREKLEHIAELPEVEELTLDEQNLGTNLERLKELFNE